MSVSPSLPVSVSLDSSVMSEALPGGSVTYVLEPPAIAPRELTGRVWDVVVVGGGHNGLTAAAYLARAGPLGARARAPRAARRRVHARAAVRRRALRRQPVRVRRRPARTRWSSTSSTCARHGYRRDARRPEPLVPVRRTARRSRLDGRRRAHRRGRSPRSRRPTSTATSPTRSCSTASGARCAPAPPRHLGRRRRPTAPSSTSCSPTTRSPRRALRRLDRRRRRAPRPRRALRAALHGQGVIGTSAGPRDPGTAPSTLMHAMGTLEGVGGAGATCDGGMGRVSFALADAARERGRGARRPACRSPRSSPARACGSRAAS